MVMQDIKSRNKVEGAIFDFGPTQSASLTSGSYPDLIVQWSEGGSCGYFVEVWGYRGDSIENLSPIGFDCGGIDVKDYLGLKHPQIATISRTYGDRQHSGGEYQERTVWCWTASGFIAVIKYSEDYDEKRLGTENLYDMRQCR